MSDVVDRLAVVLGVVLSLVLHLVALSRTGARMEALLADIIEARCAVNRLILRDI